MPVLGEHVTAGSLAARMAVVWLDDRFYGKPNLTFYSG